MPEEASYRPRAIHDRGAAKGTRGPLAPPAKLNARDRQPTQLQMSAQNPDDLLARLAGPKPADSIKVYSAAQSLAGTPQRALEDKAPLLRAIRACPWLTKKQRESLALLAERAEKERAAWADRDDGDGDGDGCPSDIDEDYWQDRNDD